MSLTVLLSTCNRNEIKKISLSKKSTVIKESEAEAVDDVDVESVKDFFDEVDVRTRCS